MPRLFKKFDQDGNGELGMDEFCDACAAYIQGYIALIVLTQCVAGIRAVTTALSLEPPLARGLDCKDESWDEAFRGRLQVQSECRACGHVSPIGRF